MKVINKEHDNWEDKLDSVCFCYRSSRNYTTKYSPFFLLYGRKPKLPIEIKVGDESASETGESDSDKIYLDSKVEQLLRHDIKKIYKGHRKTDRKETTIEDMIRQRYGSEATKV